MLAIYALVFEEGFLLHFNELDVLNARSVASYVQNGLVVLKKQ